VSSNSPEAVSVELAARRALDEAPSFVDWLTTVATCVASAVPGASLRVFERLSSGVRRVVAETSLDASGLTTCKVFPHVLIEGAEPGGIAVSLVRDDGLEDVDFAAALAPVVRAALRAERERRAFARSKEATEAESQVRRFKLEQRGADESIVGDSPALRAVLDAVKQVASTDVPVLVLGETGSGKEMIARAIHDRSSRADGPLVRVNCGAIPPELVDSELFGHEKGSFTGAVALRKGWFERADGGTLFLDEIGELPLPAQVRLLRVLQDGVLERVGGSRPLQVDVRVVAATHRDLQSMVLAGTFRSDLWFRISVFPLSLPPLRERLSDLPALVEYFGARAGVRLGGLPLTATQQDLVRLAAYDWPGNVRELAAVIERAAILGHGKRLELAAALGSSPRPRLTAIEGGASPVARLDDAMVRHIERALASANGRIEGPGGAAALLHVNPHTLRARMRKLGVEWSKFRATQAAQSGGRRGG